MTPISFEYARLSGSPSVGGPGKIFIPPNQIEFAQIFWGHVDANANIVLGQDGITAPAGVTVLFGWKDDPDFPSLSELSIPFSPEQPTVAFKVGVVLAEEAPDSGTITLVPTVG